MNKAAFLDILQHVAAISEQEVNELEKLALNFPYCQSAHLLLAKAAYDKGSMLSNQRLRRAAACATNRQLLKKLIYTSGTDLIMEPIPDTAFVPATEKEPLIAENNQPDEIQQPVDIIAPDTSQPELITAPIFTESVAVTNEATTEIIEVAPQSETEMYGDAPESVTAHSAQIVIEDPEISHDFLIELDALFSVDHLTTAAAIEDPVAKFIIAEDFLYQEYLTEDINNQKPTGKLILEPAADQTFNSFEDNAITKDTETNTAEQLAGYLPEQLYKNRLDEHTLAIANPINSDETLTRFDEYLFTPEKEFAGLSAGATKTYQEEIIYKVFDANELGYCMDSSRLGEAVLLKNELASALPYYFSPELFLEYSKQHEINRYEPPAPTVLTRQLDIIDQFLKLNPKLKSMNHVKIRPEIQEDLSSKSTKIRKTLASETLANIMVQQGKTKKAIKIYEHLILKIPEKKAYFVAQIEKLQSLT